jgi:hypothetical protein
MRKPYWFLIFSGLKLIMNTHRYHFCHLLHSNSEER